MKVHSKGSKTTARRRGLILVLAALLLVPLLGFVALVVDIGIIATAQAQLKTVTDSAALAGARQLASDRRLSTTISNLTPEMTAATQQAIAAGNANFVLGQAAQLTSSNIVIGYKNVSVDSPDQDVNTKVSSILYNSVQVTASATAPPLFSAVFRSTGSTVSVTSTATVEVDQPLSYKSNNNLNAAILPIVMGKAKYDNMINANGTAGDTYTFTSSNYNPPSSNGVNSGSDGVKESVAYPVSGNEAGNWGTIKFGVSNNSTSTLSAQIQNGITPAELLNEFPSGTVTASLAAPHQFSANPGISAGVESALTSIIGESVSIPIYSSSGGNGNNAYYNVTSFASVRIVAVNLHGSNKYVIVQPAISDDPTAIPNTSSPNSWSQGGVIFLHLSR